MPLHLSRLLFLLPLAFAACASESRKDCDKINYYDMGLQDGKKGRKMESLAEVKGKCGIEASSEDKYNYGRKVGLAEYCDESRARNDAKNVHKSAVCVQEKVPPYNIAYNRALDEVRTDRLKELEGVKKDKGKLQARQDELQSDINRIDQQKTTAQ